MSWTVDLPPGGYKPDPQEIMPDDLKSLVNQLKPGVQVEYFKYWTAQMGRTNPVLTGIISRILMCSIAGDPVCRICPGKIQIEGEPGPKCCGASQTNEPYVRFRIIRLASFLEENLFEL